MSKPRYLWRQLTESQRRELLTWRQERGHPWHSPPHRPNFGQQRFLLTAACYEHQPHLGYHRERLENFTTDLLTVLSQHTTRIFAWVVLPNHYHALVETPDLRQLLAALGRLHGRCSFLWNKEESTRGRRVFYRATDRAMRSEPHYFATLNYVHHNPVRHGYVRRWTDWPWSSASMFLTEMGREAAERLWRAFPLKNYGAGWDEPHQ